MRAVDGVMRELAAARERASGVVDGARDETKASASGVWSGLEIIFEELAASPLGGQREDSCGKEKIFGPAVGAGGPRCHISGARQAGSGHGCRDVGRRQRRLGEYFARRRAPLALCRGCPLPNRPV